MFKVILNLLPHLVADLFTPLVDQVWHILRGTTCQLFKVATAGCNGF